MRAILFPTDFSELAKNAFVYAVHLAKSIDAKLYVLHTYEAPVLSSTHAGRPESLDKAYQNIELSRFEQYQKNTPQLKEIAERYAFDISQMIFMFEEGSVSNVVKKITQQERIHLIVMGTHGQSGFLDRVVGSNTINVIKSVTTPVLAVPPHAQYNGINRVVFSTLFRDQDRTPLREALIMASQVEAHTECLHVIDNNDITEVRKQMDLWKTEFERYDVTFNILDKIESVENTITHYVLENNIDILAVIKRNRSFFDRILKASTANNLTFHSKIPIIIYHEKHDG